MDKKQAIERLKENPLDRERWIEAGKSLGWDGRTCCDRCGKECWQIRGACRDRQLIQVWKYHWHRFIDDLAEGKSIDSYFETPS